LEIEIIFSKERNLYGYSIPEANSKKDWDTDFSSKPLQLHE